MSLSILFLIVGLLTSVSAWSAMPTSPEIIQREGWSYDRAEFTNTAEEVAEARKNPGRIPLSGWAEFDFETQSTGWYELWLGGMPPEWTRDLWVDGDAVYRQLGSSLADGVQTPKSTGIQFKDTNLFFSAGRHRLRFARTAFSGALPAKWELRQVASDNPSGTIRAKILG